MNFEFTFVCPRCWSELIGVNDSLYKCPQDQSQYAQIDGIWHFLLPEREEHFRQFIDEYSLVRQAEGWGPGEAAYYRDLPYKDHSGRNEKVWKIRAKSYEVLLRHVIQPESEKRNRPLRIIDMGAGNSWLAYRLSQLGHRLAAVDLLTDRFDGLGAWIFYDKESPPWLAVQAEMDRLPFESGQTDMVIFNGAFHYVEDYVNTLRQTLEVIDGGGRVVVMDSPFYQGDYAGQEMVAAREKHFIETYGFRGNALPNENYLTYERLDELGKAFDLKWEILRPFYGWRWFLRPLMARIRGGREPAEFVIAVARGK